MQSGERFRPLSHVAYGSLLMLLRPNCVYTNLLDSTSKTEIDTVQRIFNKESVAALSCRLCPCIQPETPSTPTAFLFEEANWSESQL